MGTLEDLPSEVIVHIYAQLPIPDRLALSRVRLHHPFRYMAQD